MSGGVAAQLFARATAAHGAGDLAAAERLYRQVVGFDPGHADAANNLALIVLQAGRAQEALDLAAQALRVRRESAAYLETQGMALRALGRLAEAERALRKAVRLAPGAFGARYNLGNVLLAQDKLADAETTYREAARLAPGFAGAHNNHGLVLQRLGRPAEAAEAFRAAIGLAPGAAETWANFGAALEQDGRWEDAESAWADAVRLNAGMADFVIRHARALRVLQRHEAALPVYRRAAALLPADAEAAAELAGAFQRLGRYAEAVAVADACVQARPEDAHALGTLGGALREAGRIDESIAVLQRALGLAPDNDRLRYHAGLTWLLADRRAEGFAAYEGRFGVLRIARPGRAPDWDGRSGGTVLVYGEQGLGDVVQFLRYVPLAAARARIVLRVPVALQRLALSLRGVDSVVSGEAALPAHDWRCAVCSLPLVLGVADGAIPAAPYLAAENALVEAWRTRLAGPPGRLVGLAWQGSRSLEFDTLRSVPLGAFATLAALPGVRLVSLQKDERAAAAAPGLPILDVGDRLGDMMDTAALIEALDLVISVDSAPAHLAGALGKPCWLLNRAAPDWRWHLGRADNDWYFSVRQFRQAQPGDWGEVIDRVCAALVVAPP